MIRIFSLTLPGHENGLPATGAMQIWAEDIEKGIPSIQNFLDSAQQALDFAIRERFASPDKLAVGGLSRGAFMAAHLAARDKRFRHLLGFAPLSRLSKLKEFHPLAENPAVHRLDLTHLANPLSDRHVRLYMGNDDTQVGTRECFDFATAIVKQKKTRTSHVEFLMYPSIGKNGHGTPPEIFKQGADWIIHNLIS